uniref:Uncharacterized protein n=2 Tax=Oryza meridionalis TaxID=40149 RepID=A0A0E0EHA4_9ORYZ
MILRVASAGPGHRFQAVGQARRQDLGDGKLIYFSSLQLCLAIRNSLPGCGLQPYSEWVRAHPPFSTWICHSSSLKEIGGGWPAFTFYCRSLVIDCVPWIIVWMKQLKL